MESVIGKELIIKDPSPEIRAWARANLIIDNPDYIKKERMGLWTGGTPKKLTLYTENGSSLILPAGCYVFVKNMIGPLASTFPDFVEFIPANINLYGYQQKAVEQVINKHFGILKAPCGSGKTQMGLWLAGRGGRVLWLVHTQDLLKQSYNRALQFYEKEELGTITDGKVNIGSRITFATVQTMDKLDLTKYENEWNTVIVDECHHCVGAPTKVMMFYRVLSSLAASRKYGLSATVHRADGMIKSLFAILGPVQAEVTDADVADKTSRVDVVRVDTGIKISPECLDTDGTLVYSKLINYLAENDKRNKQIADNVALWYDQHSSLCLSDRLEQLAAIKELLPSYGVDPNCIRYIDGKVKGSDREAALEDMRTGKAKILLASYSLAKEGLDITNLDRVHFMTPQKDYAVVLQSAGRVARVAEGKEKGTVYDYTDDIGYCKKAFTARKKHYKEKGYVVYDADEIRISAG